ncbi:MAG: hypothetical protein PHH85_01905 [Candidatus Methanoperedens sp.]|nr:hypothetical protein [Candidatus Methanoperedens sp.]
MKGALVGVYPCFCEPRSCVRIHVEKGYPDPCSLLGWCFCVEGAIDGLRAVDAFLRVHDWIYPENNPAGRYPADERAELLRLLLPGLDAGFHCAPTLSCDRGVDNTVDSLSAGNKLRRKVLRDQDNPAKHMGFREP